MRRAPKGTPQQTEVQNLRNVVTETSKPAGPIPH